jgi:hypothetical protein
MKAIDAMFATVQALECQHSVSPAAQTDGEFIRSFRFWEVGCASLSPGGQDKASCGDMRELRREAGELFDASGRLP